MRKKQSPVTGDPDLAVLHRPEGFWRGRRATLAQAMLDYQDNHKLADPAWWPIFARGRGAEAKMGTCNTGLAPDPVGQRAGSTICGTGPVNAHPTSGILIPIKLLRGRSTGFETLPTVWLAAGGSAPPWSLHPLPTGQTPSGVWPVSLWVGRARCIPLTGFRPRQPDTLALP